MSWMPPVATLVPVRMGLSPFKARPDEVERLEKEMARAYSGADAFAFNSGRAALSVALSAIARERDGRGVIVPAYTCFSVASAVARAGLSVYPVDIDPNTLDFDYRDRANPPPGDVFAVISPGLFGIPGDIPALEQICFDQRLFLIEDAAQTLGAAIGDKPAGSFGDASLFSFGRGKPVGCLGGGLLVAHVKSLAETMVRQELPAARPRAFATALKGMLLFISVRSWAFSFVRLLPLIQMGASIFDPDYPVASLDPSRASVIRTLMAIEEEIIAKRRETGTGLLQRIRGIQGITIPRAGGEIKPAWLRFPIIFEDAADREAALYRLTARGFGVSTMYPIPIHRITKAKKYIRTDLGPYPGAEKVARGIVTLPTHAGVTHRAMDEMARIVREVMSAGGD
jgi:perosamine synthetase